MIAWCNDCSDVQTINTSSSTISPPQTKTINLFDHKHKISIFKTCPSCGHQIKGHHQGGIPNLLGLPAGVKFDPTDQELLEHLEGKVRGDARKLHPLIDDFIPSLEGENGICYTHPEKLPGVNKDGIVRHFFHRPSKAYTTGTRKRRKVDSDSDGGETRWHKTGKTRPVFANGKTKGYKKILVLYTNYGKQKKPEKTNWVMHQYHLGNGNNDEEKDGEIVVSKVFYQTQPRQCGGGSGGTLNKSHSKSSNNTSSTLVEFYHPSFISFDQGGGQHRANRTQVFPNFGVHGNGSSSVIP